MKAKAKETSARIGLAALAGAGMTFAFPALAFAAEDLHPALDRSGQVRLAEVRGHAGEARDDHQGFP